MGYEGDSLADMVAHLEDVSMRTGERLADAMVDHGMRRIRENTPVRTFHLRESYERTPIRYRQQTVNGYASIRWSAYAWEGEVFTEVEYAPYVEFGTGLWGPKRKKYKIQPKKPGGVLAFTPYSRMPNGGVILDVQGQPLASGKPVMVRFVMHPGSPGHHMFQIGTTMTEHEMQEWSQEPMRLWVNEFESGWRTSHR
jgi:hypothetical protein